MSNEYYQSIDNEDSDLPKIGSIMNQIRVGNRRNTIYIKRTRDC